jgi:dienelactone hydrolase
MTRSARRPGTVPVLLLLLALSACGSNGTGGATPVPSPSAVATPTPAPTLTPVPAPGPPYDRGPAPSVTALEADLGPFAVATLAVSPSAAAGYGGGTISYPTDTSEGPFGAVAVCPGHTGVQRSLQWLGPRLASNGFVVIVIDTLSPTQNAEQRAVQLIAALNQVIAFSSTGGHPLSGRVDGNRLAVIGHSYGGGGALLAGTNNPSLKAVIPLAPYYESTSFARLTVPTLVVGCQRDAVAPVSARAIPIYESIPASVSKAYLELAGGDHLCVETGNGNKAVQGKYAVAWMKRFVDEDVRYSPFLCGAPHEADLRGEAVSAYRENCPY